MGNEGGVAAKENGGWEVQNKKHAWNNGCVLQYLNNKKNKFSLKTLNVDVVTLYTFLSFFKGKLMNSLFFLLILIYLNLPRVILVFNGYKKLRSDKNYVG